MKWITNYSLLNPNGRVVVEIDRIYDNEDGYKFRTVLKNSNGEEFYQYFSKLKSAKNYIKEVIKSINYDLGFPDFCFKNCPYSANSCELFNEKLLAKNGFLLRCTACKELAGTEDCRS